MLGLTHTLLAYTRQDFVRVRDSYASLLVLLLANFFRLELDRRES